MCHKLPSYHINYSTLPQKKDSNSFIKNIIYPDFRELEYGGFMMNKLRLTELEISEIKGKLNKSINNHTESNDIADYAVTLVLDCVNQHIVNEHLLTLDECADTMQNLLDMINDNKYKPLIQFLGTIGTIGGE